MVTLSAVWDTIAGMGMAALRSFLRTMLLLFCEGVILGTVTYCWLMGGFNFTVDKGTLLAATFAVAVLLECILVGIALASKRAVAQALIHALRTHRLGQATVRLLLGRLLGVAAEQPLGQRGGIVGQAAERIPLAQLEKRMTDAIHALGSSKAEGGLQGWIRRQGERRLLGMVQQYTLARCREAGAEYGGVDLVAVQTKLESSIDDHLIRKLKHGIDLWTAVALVFLPIEVSFGNYLLSGFVR